MAPPIGGCPGSTQSPPREGTPPATRASARPSHIDEEFRLIGLDTRVPDRRDGGHSCHVAGLELVAETGGEQSESVARQRFEEALTEFHDALGVLGILPASLRLTTSSED